MTSDDSTESAAVPDGVPEEVLSTEFTGKYPEDPDELLDNPEAMLDVLTSTALGGASPEEKALQKDLSGMMWATMSAQIRPDFPQKPFTVDDVATVLRKHTPYDLSEVTVWLPSEPEEMEYTAIGEYQEMVPGYISRFFVEVDRHTLQEFGLILSRTEIGLSWYEGSGRASVMDPSGQLDLAQARRLKAMQQVNDPEPYLRLPSRIRSAALFLDLPLTGTELDPTPDGWTATQFGTNEEHSRLLRPTHEGTFVHESDIVVEVSPVPVSTETEEALEERYDQMLRGPSLLPGMASQGPSTTSERNGEIDEPEHEVNVHFAPPAVNEHVQKEYDDELTGSQVAHLLNEINKMVE